MDYTLFKNIHSLSGHSELLDLLMVFFSEWGYKLFILALLIILLFKTKRKIALIGIGSLILTLGINRLLKVIVDRPRPFVTYDNIEILIDKAASPSFPSDQAAITGVFLLVFSLAVPKLKWLFISLAVLVTFSRIYVGHHYPSDVSVGLIVGIFISYITYFLSVKYFFKQEIT